MLVLQINCNLGYFSLLTLLRQRFLKIRCVTVGEKKKKFKYLPKIQSRIFPASYKAEDLKFLMHVAENILKRIFKKKNW